MLLWFIKLGGWYDLTYCIKFTQTYRNIPIPLSLYVTNTNLVQKHFQSKSNVL